MKRPLPNRSLATMMLLAVITFPVVVSGQLGDISIHVKPTLSNRVGHGYFEYRLLISNRSPGREHLVTLEIPGQFSSGYRPLIHLRRSVTVSPGTSLAVSLLQPGMGSIRGSNLLVTVDRQQRWVQPLQLASQVGTDRFVLATASLSRENCPNTICGFNVIEQLGTSGLPLADELPGSSWLAYTSYDGIILSRQELVLLPPEVRAALASYLRAGGTMMVIGRPGKALDWPVKVTLQPELQSIEVGFGSCLVVACGVLSEANWREAWGEWWVSAGPWIKERRPDYSPVYHSTLAEMKVVEGQGIPIRSLLLLMIAFVLLIGPANLLVLKRLRRPVWLLWTVPLLSLLTPVAILTYALVAEGLTVKVRIEGLTLLDQTAERATTIGRLAYYSPLPPGDGPHFPLDAELTPLYREIVEDTTSSRVIDWTNDQHFARGWVAARVPAHFRWRSDAHRRERLEVRAPAQGPPEVINSLGVGIVDMWLADPAGRTFRASNLAAGATARLEPVKIDIQKNGRGQRAFYRSTWSTIDTDIRSQIESHLDPGTYIAIVEVNPFIDPGLEDYELVASSGVIRGIYSRPEEVAD